MPPKKVKILEEPAKASSSKAAPKAASKAASKSTKASKAAKSKAPATSAPVNPAPVAPISAPILNPDRDSTRRTRANPSPRLKDKDRKAGIEKEPSFARKSKKSDIVRTATKNAAAAARKQEAEESTQPETSTSQSPELEESRSTSPELAPHTNIPSTLRMPGTFVAEDPSSHQAAGSSKRATRTSKRARSEISDDGSDGDTEGAGRKRPAKKARNDDKPFEYFNTKPELQVNGAAIHTTTEQDGASEQVEAIPTTPIRSSEVLSEERSVSALSVMDDDVSTYFTPQTTEATQATQAVQAGFVNEVVHGGLQEVAEHSAPVQEAVAEYSEPQADAGDQPLAVAATTPVQGPVNGGASASRSVAKSSSKSPTNPGYMKGPRALSRSPDLLQEDLKKRRGRIGKSPLKLPAYKKWDLDIHLSDDSDDEPIEPMNADEMRVAKQNSQRMLDVLRDEKLGKAPMFVLRPDLQAKLDKKNKLRKQGAPSASRPRKTKIPSAIINIHVQTQNGPEVFDVSPTTSETLLKLYQMMSDNSGVLNPDEIVGAVQAAIDAKLAPVSAGPITTDEEAVVEASSTGSSTQPQSMAVPPSAPSAFHSHTTLSPIQEEEADNNGHANRNDIKMDREVDAQSAPPFPDENFTSEGRASELQTPQTPSGGKPSGWSMSVLSAIKTTVTKPFEYFGGSSRAGPSTDDDNDSGSPFNFEHTPTPALRHSRGNTPSRLLKNYSALQKGKGKAKTKREMTLGEWQAYVQESKNKQREGAAEGIVDDELPHNTYSNQSFEPGPSSQSGPAYTDALVAGFHAKYGKGYVPPKDPDFGYITPRTFVVPESSDDETDDNDMENGTDEHGITMHVTKAEKQRLEAERAETLRLTEAEVKRVEAERQEAIRAEKERRWIARIPDNLSGKWSATRNPRNCNDPYYWLRRCRMIEMGEGYEGETTTDQLKGYLKIWHERMGTVGEFTLQEQAAEREAAEKEAAEKEAAEKETAEKEAADRDAVETEIREKGAREQVEKEARTFGQGQRNGAYPSFTSQGSNIFQEESDVFGRGQPLQEVATPNNSIQASFDEARRKNAEALGANKGAEDTMEFSAATVAQQTQIEAARQQALKHQPKTSSNLQEMRRMSTPLQTPIPTPKSAPIVVLAHRDWDCPQDILDMPRPAGPFADLTLLL
ncbi:hypothetical protein BKA65DRAFT_283452 [Rhexocercosporidium sp. MPI-PUGE-AT-0058]|nr:hypothetical protein BKA65DRAFT_283452 [Rhexocercosporidium sp. MPI-PUGE-AT-0058]